MMKRYKDFNKIQLLAYDIWYSQKYRTGVEYSREDFIIWYEKEFNKKKWNRAHVARFDHNKPYSFDNIEMQEQSENNIERNNRRGNPAIKKKVIAIEEDGTTLTFDKMSEASLYYKVSMKTVYNHCKKNTKQHCKFGPKVSKKVKFSWI